MPRSKKTPLRYTVRVEHVSENSEALLDLMCRIAFGMNAEQSVQAIAKNKGGEYDFLYDKRDTQCAQHP